MIKKEIRDFGERENESKKVGEASSKLKIDDIIKIINSKKKN